LELFCIKPVYTNIKINAGKKVNKTASQALLAETSARMAGHKAPKQGAIVKKIKEKTWKSVNLGTHHSSCITI
jgi:hypothetical protein